MVCQQDAPVKNIVEDIEPGLVSCLGDQALEHGEVGGLLKAQPHDVIHVLAELNGAILAEFLVRVLFLELADPPIAGGVLRDGDALPGQTALDQVDHDVAQCDKVVAPRQLEALVRVDRHVPARANQILHTHKWDMLSSLRVNDQTSQAKINQMHCVGVLAQAHHDIVRLDVAVNVVHLVHVLHPLQQLVEEHQGGLQAELLIAEVEQVLEAGPEEVSDEEDEFVFD